MQTVSTKKYMAIVDKAQPRHRIANAVAHLALGIGHGALDEGSTYTTFKDKEGNMQGNRVKKSCGDEACKEVVVPCGDFALKTEGVLSGGPSDEVVGHVLEGGEVGRRIVGSNAAFVVAEDHVHHPVEAVLHCPMAADDRPERKPATPKR